jgi:hypothetical protein
MDRNTVVMAQGGGRHIALQEQRIGETDREKNDRLIKYFRLGDLRGGEAVIEDDERRR